MQVPARFSRAGGPGTGEEGGRGQVEAWTAASPRMMSRSGIEHFTATAITSRFAVAAYRQSSCCCSRLYASGTLHLDDSLR